MPRYRVTRLLDKLGNIAPHFLDEELYDYSPSWEAAMAQPGFAAIVDKDRVAESYADKPLDLLERLAPNDRVRSLYRRWLRFIDHVLDPWTTGGAIHFRPHWARTLMLALTMGDAAGLPDTDLDALAAMAVFHDSRRKNPYMDTGHGDRAAGYYAAFAREHADELPSATFDPRAYLGMQWHDRDDELGLSVIDLARERNELPPASSSLIRRPRLMEPADAFRMPEDATAAHPEASHLAATQPATSPKNPTAFYPAAGQPEADRPAAFPASAHPKGSPLPDYPNECIPADADADAATLYLIFKDADGLDRIRLGDNGLDPRFLRFQYAHDALPLARELLATCEQGAGRDLG